MIIAVNTAKMHETFVFAMLRIMHGQLRRSRSNVYSVLPVELPLKALLGIPEHTLSDFRRRFVEDAYLAASGKTEVPHGFWTTSPNWRPRNPRAFIGPPNTLMIDLEFLGEFGASISTWGMVFGVKQIVSNTQRAPLHQFGRFPAVKSIRQALAGAADFGFPEPGIFFTRKPLGR